MRAFLTVLMLVFALPAQAQKAGENIVPMHGMVCDTQQQVERLLKVFDGLHILKAAKQVNDENKNPEACIVTQLLAAIGKAVSEVVNRGTIYDVLPILVLGGIRNGRFQPLNTPIVWFTFKAGEKQSI